MGRVVVDGVSGAAPAAALPVAADGALTGRPGTTAGEVSGRLPADTGPRAAAVLLCATSLVLAVVGLVLVAGGAIVEDVLYRYWREAAATAVAFSAVGGLVTVRRPRCVVGWVFAALGLLTSVQLVSGQVATAAEPPSVAGGFATVSVLTQGLAVGGLVVLVLLFPTGRLPSSRWRPVLWAAAVGFGLATLAQALGPTHLEDFAARPNPAHVPIGESARVGVAALSAVLCGGAACGAVAALVVRLRTGGRRERLQLKWFVWAIASTALVLLVGDVVVPGAGDYGWLLGPTAVAAAAAVSVLRYDLYDIDVIIRRSVVLAVLTLLIVAGYVGAVQAVALVLPADADGRAPSVLATAAVAVAFAPVRERVQRLVDRRLFGLRNDPYGAVTALAEQLDHAPTPDDVLQVAVTTVASAVRSPFAAVEVCIAGHEQIAASCGDEQPAAVRVPLTYQGETVGHLAVAARAGERAFSAQDVRLLTELARQVGMAAHAVALSTALQRSREHLVTAREEERRRLRRDLHDGLGPTLTGVALLADAARSQLARDPAGAEGRLRELRAETKGAIESIRRLVYDLRPPALDELGLVEALREHTRRLGTGDGDESLRVRVEAEDLPPLTAAVEVAVYRIVSEAVTNVARHGHARHCEVRLRLRDQLEVAVSDDGVGVPSGVRAGVGLTSMRERASELGGTVTIAAAAGGGTVVTALLPLIRG